MKFKVLFVSVSFIVSGLLLSSCKDPKAEPQQGPGPGTDLRQEQDVEPTYEWLAKNVFELKCIKCHSGPTPPHGIDLTTYELITKSPVFPALVVPGDPDDSSLFDSVNVGRMPKRAGKLPQAEIDALREWIKTGAKENPSDPDPVPSPSPTPCEEPNPDDCEF